MKKEKPTKWHKLDNTANIFPVVASKRMTNVFRLTAVLKEPIIPAHLQAALVETLPFFSAFSVRLRHGLFWSYFETNRAIPHIEPEQDYPCRYINPIETNRYLFRVLYFENRIHLEVFHALTDATGAMRFLRALCYSYIKQVHREDFTELEQNTPYGVENAANTEDSYLKNYLPAKAATFKEPSAYHMRGEARMMDSVGVLSATLPVQDLKALCRESDASVTEYITALLAHGVYREYMGAGGAKRPVNIFVPVDLRRIFPSQTSLNFFSNITITLYLQGVDLSFEDVLAKVKEEFAAKLTREKLAQKLAFTARSETNMITRIVPLPIKNGIIRIIYEHSNHGSTMPFSNLGIVDINEKFAKYFEGFRFLLYAAPHDPVKCSAVSYGGKLSLTFTSLQEDWRLARSVVRALTAHNIPVEVESNGDGNDVL
ncbi:MAG: hypothetical protein RSE10_04075 [Oscillospiraceae bacterium]